ncbi:MAG: ribosomal protein S18-alanine N-acetyltransferase [Candidatus Limnocylindrales bacterium]
MVARPPLKVVIGPMLVADVGAVQAIEQASFSAPWPPNAYLTELQTNRLAHYMVVRVGDSVVGYAGLWLMVDEAHITTFAIHPDWRRRHLGERLLLALLDIALERRAAEATLEVRLSNLPARRLYEKSGFRPVGIRPRYYTDNNEDALIMTTERLDGDAMRDRLARLRSAIDAAPDPTEGGAGSESPDGSPGEPARDRERAGRQQAPGQPDRTG